MKLNILNLVRPSRETASPIYWAGRRGYNERYSLYQQNADRWRWIAFGCIGVAALAVGALGYANTLPKFRPYVVERDQLGDQVAIGLVQEAGSPDIRVIQSEIRKWLYNVRTVSTDAETAKRNILDAYNHTDKSGPAKSELDEWFIKHNPFKRAENESVTITITTAIPTYPHQWKAWRANWTEETRTRSGELMGSPQRKEISIEVSYKTPATEDDFKKNSSGVFFYAFDWIN